MSSRIFTAPVGCHILLTLKTYVLRITHNSRSLVTPYLEPFSTAPSAADIRAFGGEDGHGAHLRVLSPHPPPK